MRIFPENMSSSALISTVDMKTEFAFKKEILACNGLFPLRRHKIWFGSNSWGEYFLRKKMWAHECAGSAGATFGSKHLTVTPSFFLMCAVFRQEIWIWFSGWCFDKAQMRQMQSLPLTLKQSHLFYIDIDINVDIVCVWPWLQYFSLGAFIYPPTFPTFDRGRSAPLVFN